MAISNDAIAHSAQYTTQSDLDKRELDKEADQVNWYINRTFWIASKRKAPIRFDFFLEPPPYGSLSPNKFFADSDTSFTVLERVVDKRPSKWDRIALYTTVFKIKFLDGKEAFVIGDQLQRSEDATLGHLSRGRKENWSLEYIYESEPKKLKAQLARKAGPKKEGVSIGMTATNVRASSWGAPAHINRTTTADSVREQWVYSSGGYIYLTDGVITAIQN